MAMTLFGRMLRIMVINAGTVKMPALSGSASLKDGKLAITLTNPSLDSSLTARIRLTAGAAAEARASVLTHADMMARNTFDRPENVKLAALPVGLRGGAVEVAIPKHSVVSLEVRVS